MHKLNCAVRIVSLFFDSLGIVFKKKENRGVIHIPRFSTWIAYIRLNLTFKFY